MIQLQLRHDNRKILERLQDAVVHLRKKLPSPGLNFDVVGSYLGALRGAEEKYKGSILARKLKALISLYSSSLFS